LLSRPSGTEPRPIILRRGGQQARKTAAHCLLRAEAAARGDALDRQAGVGEQAARGFHAQALHGAGWGEPGRLSVVPAEAVSRKPTRDCERNRATRILLREGECQIDSGSPAELHSLPSRTRIGSGSTHAAGRGRATNGDDRAERAHAPDFRAQLNYMYAGLIG
jgi:hypothetical protein